VFSRDESRSKGFKTKRSGSTEIRGEVGCEIIVAWYIARHCQWSHLVADFAKGWGREGWERGWLTRVIAFCGRGIKEITYWRVCVVTPARCRRRGCTAEGWGVRGEKWRSGGRIGTEDLSRGGRASLNRSIFNPSPDENTRQQRLLQTGARIDRSFLCALARGAVRSRPFRRRKEALGPREELTRGWQRVLLSYFLLSPGVLPFLLALGFSHPVGSRCKSGMEGKKVEQYYTPPPKLGKWEGFRVFLWNSETGQFLGRTGASWGKFFLTKYIFYSETLISASPVESLRFWPAPLCARLFSGR